MTQRLKKVNKAQTRALYIEWLLTSKDVRRMHGLALTDKEWGLDHGVDPRTLRRWKNDDPEFARLLEQRRAEQEALGAKAPTKRQKMSAVDEALERAGVDGGTPEADYITIRTKLRELAEQGDVQAAAQWMKLFGEPFIEAERAKRKTMFGGLDDDEVVDRVLMLVGVERVSSWLADRVVGG